jgi:hypothetical protein
MTAGNAPSGIYPQSNVAIYEFVSAACSLADKVYYILCTAENFKIYEQDCGAAIAELQSRLIFQLRRVYMPD